MKTRHALLLPLSILLLGPFARAQQLYGEGTAGTGGTVPRIWMAESPWPGNSAFKITLDEVGGQLAAWIGLGVQRTSIPLAGIKLNVGLLAQGFVGLTTGTPGQANGSLALPAAVPNQSSLIGQHFDLQWVIFDPNGPQGLAASRGLEILIGHPPLVLTCGSAGTRDPIYAFDPRTSVVTSWQSAIGANNPADVQFTPDGSLVVVAASLSRSIIIGDATRGGARLAAVTSSLLPNATAITPDGKRCYAILTAAGTGATGAILEIDLRRGSTTFGQQIATVSGLPTGAGQLEGVAISVDGKVMTVSNLGLGSTPMLFVIDIDKSSTNFNRVTRTIRASGWMTDVAPNPDGSLIIAVAAGLSTTSTLYIYDASTGFPIKVISTLGAFATDVDIGPHGEYAYVSTPNSNSVSRVGVDPKRASYGSVITSVGKLAGVFAVALSPDASKLYTAESRGDKLYELDAKTLKVLRTVTVGADAGAGIAVR